MMTFVRIAAAAGVAALLSMGTASAATIDFSVFPGGSQGTNVLVTPNATFTTTDGIFLNQGGRVILLPSVTFRSGSTAARIRAW